MMQSILKPVSSFPRRGAVAELADAADLKSAGRRPLWVRVPPALLFSMVAKLPGFFPEPGFFWSIALFFSSQADTCRGTEISHYDC